MKPRPHGDDVLTDYTTILHSLLPAAAGFVCYGRDGRVLWSDLDDEPVLRSEPCQLAVQAILANRRPVAPLRINAEGAVAFVMPLGGEDATAGVRDADPAVTGDGRAPQRLGAIVVVLNQASAGAPDATATDATTKLLRPLVRILEREFDLRLRLRDSFRRLNVQAAEEHLLHLMEKAIHEDDDSQRILNTVLTLCRHYLEVESAAVLIPDRGLRIVRGKPVADDLLEKALDAPPAQTDGVGDEFWLASDVLVIPIRPQSARTSAQAASLQMGIIVLAGWGASPFSQRRRSRVARYIASHVGSVAARDYDPLTGLMAWAMFERRLALAVEARAAGPYTVVCFDIDRLQVANDTLGRETGDAILASFARLLQQEFTGCDVTRITGDSFAVIVPDADMDIVRAHGEAVMAAFRGLEYHRGESTYRPSASVGVGPLAADPETPGGPLAFAQVACQAAKDRGRNRLEIYEAGDVSIIRRLDDIQVVGFVRNAIDRGRFVLLGQPIVPTRNALAKPYFEVLVRLLDDDDAHVAPSEFFSAAERYQLMDEIDRWVVSNTLRLLSANGEELQRAGARFAINLSGQSLGSDTFLQFVSDQFARHAVPPEIVCFEITETVAIANLQRAQALMHNLRRTGCRFSLDDFGTGLSSFAYLKLFPVDTLKIDGSFIRDLKDNAISQSLVAAISEVARVMGLETVAEYVESRETLKLLSRMGITWAQGHLIGKPMPLDGQLAGLLQKRGTIADRVSARP